jgi:hypothetical protein
MSIITHAVGAGFGFFGERHLGHSIEHALDPPNQPPPPQVPNPNDAANVAQSLTDSMRMRRGLLSNIYAGASSTAPVTGKTMLGQ